MKSKVEVHPRMDEINVIPAFSIYMFKFHLKLKIKKTERVVLARILE